MFTPKSQEQWVAMFGPLDLTGRLGRAHQPPPAATAATRTAASATAAGRRGRSRWTTRSS